MMDPEVFEMILDRAGIDFVLLQDPEEVLETADQILFEVMLEHADGDESQPISDEEKGVIIQEAADRLSNELHQRFHGR
jgi:hypothetical protein